MKERPRGEQGVLPGHSGIRGVVLSKFISRSNEAIYVGLRIELTNADI